MSTHTRRARRAAPRPLPAVLIAAAVLVGLAAVPSQADVSQPAIVSARPTNTTPDVLSEPGSVRALADAGSTIVAGGEFTSVQSPGSSTPLTRTRVFAFSAANGQVTPSFAPTVDGQVNAVALSPDNASVYIGGEFKNVNGQSRVSLAKLDLSTGALDPTFNQPKLDGRVFSIKVANGKVYVAGSFAHIGTTAVTALAALNPTTGAVDPTVNVGFGGVHNSGITTIRKIDLTPDGTRLVAVGNFKTVGGLDREQVAMIDLTGPSASVADWETDRFKPACKTTFDTTVKDIAFAPDGSYFVIASTAGYNYGTLCDTSSRWETGATGTALQPTWVNATGGDTTWSVAVTGTAVYVGGHFRWQNNPYAGDKPGEGAVPREGLAALDPRTGVPFDWNPGRVLGEGAFDLLPTAAGLYVGHDTNYIGGEYHRKLAFFPLAGGSTVPNPSTGSLPGRVYRFGTAGAAATSPVLYRVNAGGPPVAATDGGPVWDTDTGAAPSAYHNAGSTARTWTPVTAVNRSVPTSTPKAIFTTERTDPSAAPEMSWSFPVDSGTPVEVRLYFASQDPATQAPESRVFDVTLDGKVVRTKYDIVKDAGYRIGTMQALLTTSDGSVDIGFVHRVSDPTISGIEIVTTCGAKSGNGLGLKDAVVSNTFSGDTAGPTTPVAAPATTAWSQSRGALMLSGQLYTAWADGHLCKRTFDGQTFGVQHPVELYNNKMAGPKNAVSTGALAGMGAMFFANNRLYYTVKSKSQLFYRYFSPQADVLGAEEFTATFNMTGVTWGKVNGMFLAPDPLGSGKTFLYFSQSDTQNLSRMTWNGTAPIPGAKVLSGPKKDGIAWTQQGLALLANAGEVAPNMAPRAAAGAKCSGLTCWFTSAGSGDTDGTIASYLWTFGDASTSTSATPTHAYAAPGTYTVKLTVTDNSGASSATTRTVTVPG